MSAPRVAVLAVQGAFAEHEAALRRIGCEACELRQGADVLRSFDALVLPGGESTAQAKLLRELGMLEGLRALVAEGLPTLGTCAGLVLLAREVRDAPDAPGAPGAFATLPVAVVRNAYGRQLASFHAQGRLVGDPVPFPLCFIRAPRIVCVGEGAEVLVVHDGEPVAVRLGNQIGCAFHPELAGDDRIHEALVALVRRSLHPSRPWQAW